MRLRFLALMTLTASLGAAGSCGSGGEVLVNATTRKAAESFTATFAARESALDLTALVAFLSDHGIPCERVDIENEGATAVPNGPFSIAMCYRSQGLHTLELSLYRSAQERAIKRAPTVLVACAQSPENEALSGLTMTIAEGDNFDIRAAESQMSTPESLAALNAATETVATQAQLRLGKLAFECGS
ncbi:MAG: hypothetical protein F2659_05155 [Actinobacteria bacterium]|uniref:Unannotated protein n=1 Tax=freshwater metagenome TaxID=449393 RepID=A0A6J6PKQ2_9ZZZZ|nr:hypothetical protein [Actinomycetota bacterium]